MQNAIKDIVIVGGGSAGWISAATIAAKLKKTHQHGFKVTLVESANVPTIGVGEGTWPTMRRTLKNIGVSETDFIKACHVSFKQGAKFAKWTTGEENDSYYHPLVLPEDFDNTNLAPHWLALQKLHQDIPDFANSVCPQASLCDQGLAPKKITTPEYSSDANYAYHLDAGKFAEFLKQHCLNKLNVNHIVADVEAIQSAENNDISALTTQCGQTITGDFFIDCTGSKSLLIGEHYQIPFVSCKEVLFVDRALAVQVPYADENSPIASHTISTAQSAGWIWDIGLSSRRGVGHVYASNYISDEQAKQELLNYLAPSVENLDALTFRTININPGHREKFWQNNCVAIGMAAGFLEPLEASALLLIEIAASFIAEQLPADRGAMDVIAARYNQTFLYRWQSIIDFLKLHYMLTKREDSAFWRDNKDPSTIPSSLKAQLELWQYQTPWHGDFSYAQEVFPAASFQYVLYGMGFKTKAHPLGLSELSQQHALALMKNNAIKTQQLSAQLPSNRSLINAIKAQGLHKI
ncbi:tryptophan halogenase family protein [Thalassotalea sp. PLHSN55]|uniref:tryptophan halogenase family protein n=1 Tax=Thalassotalea sp. PLHSN55 TaxID=3435888 RepID=UPI003F875AE1